MTPYGTSLTSWVVSGSAMAEEIGEEFKRSGFTFDEEEEILKRCKLYFSFLFALCL